MTCFMPNCLANRLLLSALSVIPVTATLAVLAGCEVAPDTQPRDVAWDANRDASELPDQTDLPDGILMPDADGEGQEADLAGACRALLHDWQCLDSSDCPVFQACTRPMSCEIPPCWGDSCQDFPGVCLARTYARTCTKAGDCPTGQGCAGAFTNGVVTLPGSCRDLPEGAGACFSDLDCTGGLLCAGETACDTTRLGTCTDHPGRCGPLPVAGSCLDDGDCGGESWCKGATLCELGNDNCADLPGTCESGARPGCTGSADCKSGDDGTICVSAVLNHPGNCTPGPKFHAGECWQDSDCGTSDSCLGTAPCPPGDRCRAGGMHGGYCGPFPARDSPGIEINYSGVVGNNPDGVAVIRNGLPVAIVFSPCLALNLQVRSNDETWPIDSDGVPTEFRGWMDHASCDINAVGPPFPRLRVPAGGSMVLVGLQAGGTLATSNPFRLVLLYQMGSDTEDPDTQGCRVMNAYALSTEFN